MKLKILILPTIAIISIVGLSISFINCGEPDPCAAFDSEPQYFDIPAEDTLKIPYKGYETLKFQVSIDSQIVDTITFIGQGRVKSYEEFNPGDAPGYCVTYYGEIFTYTFNNIDNTDVYKHLIFNYVMKHTASMTIDINEIEFYGDYYVISGQGYKDPRFFDVIEINKKIFYNVHLFTDYWLNINKITNDDPLLYFNKSVGIIRIKINSHVIWDLIN
ncbi:MAG: hypothetical protein U9R42_14555 [Bacteroidota bacterium]|nr:hypothetical protein [Bacteroidota bacterium]